MSCTRNNGYFGGNYPLYFWSPWAPWELFRKWFETFIYNVSLKKARHPGSEKCVVKTCNDAVSSSLIYYVYIYTYIYILSSVLGMSTFLERNRDIIHTRKNDSCLLSSDVLLGKKGLKTHTYSCFCFSKLFRCPGRPSPTGEDPHSFG